MNAVLLVTAIVGAFAAGVWFGVFLSDGSGGETE